MKDRFNRTINYLRISVTDKCNLRCSYCMPAEGVEWIAHEKILRFEEICEVVKYGVSLGIKKVRLTGGEPLVRRGIVDLVKMLSEIEGIDEITMTTNGILLKKYAQELKDAGLTRVNISLDTLNSEAFNKLTRGGNLEDVFEGIKAAQKADLTPIKINCVIFKSPKEADAQKVAEFAKVEGLKIRYIHQMNLETGEFSKVKGGEGGDCAICNRLRLSADGKLKPCLFSALAYDIRELGIAGAYDAALTNKPESGTKNLSGKFYNIGG